METIGQFDGDLEMFCEPKSELNLPKLKFLRWLSEQGKLEHEVFGQPTGDYAELAGN